MRSFSVFLLHYLSQLIFGQFNLYQTDSIDPFEFDCLVYYTNEQYFRGVRFQTPTYQKITYCRRPRDPIDDSPTDSSVDATRFSFDELRRMNITVEQFFSWSASMDFVEKYALYSSATTIDHPFASESFLNCTTPWFGSRCEYSFELGPDRSFSDVVHITFQEKIFPNHSPHRFTNLTCYELLPCDRGAPLCLDWREVCNGRIDCENGGVDEEHCWLLEMNECAPDEYRCHNGLCIPKDFLHDDRNNPDCLDRTDEKSSFNTFDSCYQDPTFRCEEHTCHPNFANFPCGDGQCEMALRACRNNREELLKGAILAQGTLSHRCWLVMACLTQLNTTINGQSCFELFNPISMILLHLHDCPSSFQYPTSSILLGHIRFFYFNNHTNVLLRTVFPPDLICYDAQLCDTIHPSISMEGLTCQRGAEIIRGITSYYETIVKNVTAFFQSCASNRKKFSSIPQSMHQCNSSSKVISKHRLLDFSRDCPMGDDEIYRKTCALNDPFRIRCHTTANECYSPILTTDICNTRRKDNYSQIFFQHFCNGIDNGFLQQIDGYNHTDENDCQQWPCENIYTRCDGTVHCSDGADEWNCFPSNCSFGTQPCFSPINHTLICLPYSQVGDGRIDCLGASDESKMCQKNISETRFQYRYRCWNQTKCTAAFNLCDGQNDCNYRDDEKLCSKKENPCPKTSTTPTHLLCHLFNREIERKVYFSIENISAVPSKPTTKPIGTATQQKEYRPADPNWSWRCNRGLYARYRDATTNETFRCFCPPSYYGEFCEYQNERVSVTLGILTAYRYKLYTIVIRLLDEQNRTVAYEQFPFMGIWGCYRPFNVYLLYPTRPKNHSSSYTIQIDAYDRMSMSYWSSWNLDVPFLFLPVNRIVSQLTIPVEPVATAFSCPRTCLNGGECKQYVNTGEFFCHCPKNWMGLHCERPANCSLCSNCVGSVAQQPICLCPINRAGPRCLLNVSCPVNMCLNDGFCLVMDDDISLKNYICVCNERFYGPRCEFAAKAFVFSLKEFDYSPYILAYAVTVSNESQPMIDVMIQKTIVDQTSVTFYPKEPVHLFFLQINREYYLATESLNKCNSHYALIDPSERSMPPVRLIKNYHLLCSRHSQLSCFFDGYYMCLCTSTRQANCFEFNHNFDLSCRNLDFCQNGGSCYQNHQTCPSATICICSDCYFGPRCEYYAQTLGVTLDDILRYEFRRNNPLSRQSLAVILSAVITGVMFGIGAISSIASFLTFRQKKVQQVGCGLYLLAASITSFFTVSLMMIKFWFLVSSQLSWTENRTFLRIGCASIEPLLKILFYVDHWFKACVAIERSITVYRGIAFNKSKSRYVAKWVIVILPILVFLTMIHEPIYRRFLADDEREHRNWCVVSYPTALRRYNSVIIVSQYLFPFLINLSSAIFIIVSVARQRMLISHQQHYRSFLRDQFSAHKHMLISPIILVFLSLPRLIISLVSNCIKSSDDPWFYFAAYFISFTPSVLMFVVFVLPSDLYNREFMKHFHGHSDTS